LIQYLPFIYKETEYREEKHREANRRAQEDITYTDSFNFIQIKALMGIWRVEKPERKIFFMSSHSNTSERASFIIFFSFYN
jgi:hypothetical protein